jgi:hypothetical protein
MDRPRKVWVDIANWSVILFSVAFILFGRHEIRRHRPRSFSDLTTSRVFVERKRVWRKSAANPPPHPNFSASANASLYVAVVDFDNEPGPHHCQIKRQWMDAFVARDNVENVELYSLTSWTNAQCGLQSLSAPRPPRDYVDPSAWLFVNVLRLALNRSASGWLFVVRDAAYIRVGEFFELFESRTRNVDPFRDVSLFGGCLEQRYFFQMLVPESGVFMSRRFAEEVLRPGIVDVWTVVMDAGIHYDEAFAHCSDEVGIYMKASAVDQLLGRGWRNHSHFDALASKDFDDLPYCRIPLEYLFNAPGELGLCSRSITPFNSVVSWAASDPMDKVQFLSKAHQYMEGNPDELGFYWDRTRPTLCMMRAASNPVPRPPAGRSVL